MGLESVLFTGSGLGPAPPGVSLYALGPGPKVSDAENTTAKRPSGSLRSKKFVVPDVVVIHVPPPYRLPTV